MRHVYETAIHSPDGLPPMNADGYVEVFDCRAEVALEPWERREDRKGTTVEVASLIAVVEEGGLGFHCRFDER